MFNLSLISRNDIRVTMYSAPILSSDSVDILSVFVENSIYHFCKVNLKVCQLILLHLKQKCKLDNNMESVMFVMHY